MHWFGGIFGMYLPMAVLVAIAYYAGSGVMQNVLDAIPQFVQNGLTISAGILPALGFAILLRMILNKKIAAFLAIGFVLTAYVGLPVLGVAIMAVSIVMIMAFGDFSIQKAAAEGPAEMEEEDDDF